MGKAESHFRRALELNSDSAAAHNNLGNLLLDRHELYLAAWEYQRSADLSPRSPIPHVNLGLVYEAADQLDQSIECYNRALELEPNNAVALGNLVRIYVVQDADPFFTSQLLRTLLYIDNRPEWIDWAEELLATRYRTDGQSVYESNDMPAPAAEPLVIPESSSAAPEVVPAIPAIPEVSVLTPQVYNPIVDYPPSDVFNGYPPPPMDGYQVLPAPPTIYPVPPDLLEGSDP